MLWKRMKERNPDFLWAETQRQARNRAVLGKDKARHYVDGFFLSQLDINYASSSPDRRKLQRQVFGNQEINFSWNTAPLHFSKSIIKPKHLQFIREFLLTSPEPFMKLI